MKFINVCKFSLFLIFCSMNVVNADEHAIYESDYLKLDVYPNLSVSSNNIHTQFCNLSSKIDVSDFFNASLRFDENVTIESAYLQRSNISGNGTIQYYWSEVSLEYVYFNGKHYFVAYNAYLGAYGSKYFRIRYRVNSSFGKWDFIARNDQRGITDILDPYWTSVGIDQSGDASTTGIVFFETWGKTNGQATNWQDNESTLFLKRKKITISNDTGVSYNYSSVLLDLFVLKSNGTEFRLVFHNQSDYYELFSYRYDFNSSHYKIFFRWNFSINPLEENEENKTCVYLYWINQSQSDRSYFTSKTSVFDVNLISYWSCDYGSDTTLYDQLDNNDGTFKGTNEPKWNDTHIWDDDLYSLGFDGINDYVTLANENNFDFGTGDFSIALWIKASNSQADPSAELVMKYPGGGEDGWDLRLSRGTSLYYPNFYVIDSGAVSAANVNVGVNDSTWHHIVAVRGGDIVYLYVDGVLVDSTSGAAGKSVSNAIDVKLGTRHLAVADYFNGNMDEVYIFSRALNLYEVQTLATEKRLIQTTGVEGDYEAEERAEIVGYNSTHNFTDVSSGFYVCFGDIQVDTQATSQIMFESSNSIFLNVTLAETEGELIVTPMTNTTTGTMNFTINIVPSQYYDETQTLTISVTTNDPDEGSFSINVTYKSSTPTYYLEYIDYNDTNGFANLQVDTTYNFGFSVLKSDGGPNNLSFFFMNYVDNESTYDYLDTERIFLEGSLDTYDAYGITALGTYAYIADYDEGLKIIDVSNKSNPTLVGSLDTYKALSIRILGDYVYIADHNEGLKIINVSNKSNPSLVGSLATYLAAGIYVLGDYVYIADHDEGLKIINVSNKSNPFLVGSLDTYRALSLHVLGDYVYIADHDEGLKVINVSNKSNPFLVGSLDTYRARDTFVVDDYVYLADDSVGLKIINISNKSNPILLGSIDTYSTRRVQVLGNYVHITDSSEGLKIIDVSNKSNPTLIGSIDTYSANDLLVLDKYVYIGDNDSGLKIIKAWQNSSDDFNVTINLQQYMDSNYTLTLQLNSYSPYGFLNNSPSLTYKFMSSTPILGVNLSMAFGNLQVDTEYNLTIVLEEISGGPNNLTVNNWTSNNSLFYSVSPISIFVNNNGSNTTTIYFNPDMFYDSLQYGKIIWNCSALFGLIDVNYTDVSGMSSTPTFWYNISGNGEFGNIRIDEDSANLTILLYLNASGPNNISLLAYSSSGNSSYMYFNVSTITLSSNVTYSAYINSQRYRSDPIWRYYSFNVDETFGAIDNESVLVNQSHYSTPPNLTTDVSELYFGDIQVDKWTEYSETYAITYTNPTETNDAIITGLYPLCTTFQVANVTDTVYANLEFDNSLNDTNHNLVNGSLTGTETYVSGKIGQAISLDGSTYINYAPSSLFNFSCKSDATITMSMWFQTSAVGTQTLFSKQATDDNSAGYQVYLTPAGRICMRVVDSVNNQIRVQSSTLGHDDGTWKHLVITYDGDCDAQSWRFYLDNTQLTMDIVEDTLTGEYINDIEFEIGSKDNGHDPFTGLMDTMIWYEQIISEYQISVLWNNGNGSTHDEIYVGGEIAIAPNESYTMYIRAKPAIYHDSNYSSVLLLDLLDIYELGADVVIVENVTLIYLSTTPILGVNLSYNFGDSQVDVEHSVTITFEELSGVNNLTVDNLTTNNSLFYSVDPFSFFVDSGSFNTTTVYFLPDIYYDTNTIGQIIWNCTTLGDLYGLIDVNSTVLIGKSITPILSVVYLLNGTGNYTRIEYQENCDANYSTGTWDATGHVGRANDGDWVTWAKVNQGNSGTYYCNYTKPIGVLSSVLQMKYYDTDFRTVNVSLPVDCWDSFADVVMLRVRMYPGVISYTDSSWEIYNSSDSSWALFKTYSKYEGGNLYEEAMWWNISSSADYAFEDELFLGNTYNLTVSFEEISGGSNNITVNSMGTTDGGSYSFLQFPVFIDPGGSNSTIMFILINKYYDDPYHLFVWSYITPFGVNISNSTSLLYTSLTPTLSYVVYDYNTTLNVLPEDNISFNFSINNTNLNTVKAKNYIWTLGSQEDLTTNFSTITSSQYSYNSTYSSIFVYRDDISFDLHSLSCLIRFYGINSEQNNNIFNLTIYPNFTMVDFEYLYYVLSQFSNKEIDTKYTEKDDSLTWRIWNSGTYDFNITTREDTYSQAHFSYEVWNYLDPTITTYHDISQMQYFKLTFENPNDAHQAEFWVNVSANKDATLKMSINGVTHTTSVTTSWAIKNIYTDDLIHGTNIIYFQVYGASDAHIYIKNTTANTNLTLYISDPFVNYIELTNSSIGIDIIFCDFIFNRQIEKYPTDTPLQIVGGDNNEWDMVYYPSIYTQDSYVRINFILENINGRYLDNFTAIFQLQCPRYVVITSDIDDLDATVYVGEENVFYIAFENVGVINASITNITSSISWIIPQDVVDLPLDLGVPLNVSFTTNSELSLDHVGYSYVLTVSLSTTSNGTYSDYGYIYVQARAKFNLISPLEGYRYIKREAKDTKTTSFTISNIGEESGDYSIDIIDPNVTEGMDSNSLRFLGTSFTLEKNDIITLEFEVYGDVVIDNETWIIQIYQDYELVATFYIEVKTEKTDEPGSWTYMLALWIISLVTLIASLILRRKYKLKNDATKLELEANDEYNLKAEKEGRSKRKPTSKLQMKIWGRKVLLGMIFFSIFALIAIPIYLWYTNSYEAPWEFISIAQNEMF